MAAKKSSSVVYYPNLPPHEAVRTIREMQEMSQAQLAEASGIPQPTISSIESGRVALGVERAKRLALALKVHPAVLLFSDWHPEGNPRSERMIRPSSIESSNRARL
jgi:transcriptional regulator with XRE-family HTH domain